MADSTPFAHDLVTRLERACPRLGVHDLPQAASLAEVETRKQIKEAVQKICFPLHQVPKRVLDIEGVPHEICVSEYPDDPSRLGVAVVPRILASAPAKLSRLQIKTPSVLRTQSATVRLPDSLVAHQDVLAAVTSSIIGAGSTWFERRLISSLKIAEADVISSLYTYFLALLPTGLAKVPIWFGTASRKHSHYILDPSVAGAAMRGLIGSADTLTSGPGASIADFLNAAIPAEQAFATEVIKAQQCLEIDFRQAKYKNDFGAVQLAEIAMFGGTSCSLFPICVEGGTYLLAVFPSEFKTSLLPILEACKEELTERFKRARSPLDRAYRKLLARGWAWSPAGMAEITGRFLGGFTAGASS